MGNIGVEDDLLMGGITEENFFKHLIFLVILREEGDCNRPALHGLGDLPRAQGGKPDPRQAPSVLIYPYFPGA